MPQELVYLLEGLKTSPVFVEQIRAWTDRDPVLAKVRRFVQHGWPRTVNPVLQPYHSRQLELSIQNNCLLWGSRVIVHKQERERDCWLYFMKITQEFQRRKAWLTAMCGGSTLMQT